MKENLLKNSFLEFCEKNKFEKNDNQLEIVNQLENFLSKKKPTIKEIKIIAVNELLRITLCLLKNIPSGRYKSEI